jgi:hypothetical protein
MPNRKRIADLDLQIENLLTAILALRTDNAKRGEMDRRLSELARLKAERLRLMLRQVNSSAEQRLHQTTAPSAPNESEATAARRSTPDG